MLLRCVSLTVLPNGDLSVSLGDISPEDRKELREILTEKGSDTVLWEVLEWSVCNSDWDWLRPEEIGALTSAPILTDDVTRNDHGEVTHVGNVWWFPNYMVEDPAKTLLDKGQVVFTKGSGNE